MFIICYGTDVNSKKNYKRASQIDTECEDYMSEAPIYNLSQKAFYPRRRIKIST